MLPIFLGDIVLTGTVMVTEVLPDGHSNGGRLGHPQALASQEFEDGLGIESAQELALRVSPTVLDGTGDVERPRSRQREDVMLVQRHAILVLGIGDILGREPMREATAFIISSDDADRLTKDTLTERGTTTTRLIRDDERETGVLRTSPEGSLPQAGMSNHRYAFGVDGRIALQSVERA